MTCNIERTICQQRARQNKCTCSFLNDGRFTFYRTPMQMLSLDFYDNSIIVSNLIRALNNRESIYMILHVTDAFFIEETLQFEEKSARKYSYMKEHDLFVLLLDYDVNIHTYIEEPLFNMICNNLFVSFWLADSMPCLSVIESVVNIDIKNNGLLITFSFDGTIFIFLIIAGS